MVHIKKNVRIVSGLDNSDGRACWFSDGERDMIIEAIQEAKEFRNKKFSDGEGDMIIEAIQEAKEFRNKK